MRKITQIFTCILAAVLLLTGILPTATVKAEGAAKHTYTVTFRAGNVGRFQTKSDNFLNENIEVTANYIKFKVEKGQSLASSFDFICDDAELDAFFLNITDDINEGYRLKSTSDWCSGAAEAAVNRNTEYVLDYAKLVNPVKYEIRFVDAASGEQIAPPTIAYGSAGEELVCNPLSITSYVTEDQAVNLVLNAENETANSVTFRYTYNGETAVTVETVTEYTPGGTVVNTIVEDVTAEQPAGAAVVTPDADDVNDANDANDANDIDDANDAQEVTIEDEEVPLGNEENLVDIEDEEVPLAAEEESAEFYWKAVAGGVIAVIAAAAATMVFVRRRRKSAK